jgi:DNA-binding CsgD family transcriptional regulator
VKEPAVRAEIRRVTDQLVQGVANSGPTVGLSPRELDVLCAAAAGCRNREIAQRLSLTPSTVKSYLRSAMTKLDSNNRMDAVRVARRHGLLP